MAPINQPQGNPTQLQKEPMVMEEVDMTKVKKSKRTLLYIYVVIVVLGIATGYGLFKAVGGSGLAIGGKVESIKSEKTEGVTDVSTFKDQAEGLVELGGIEEEGTHKLTREGGPSQTVALVSSVLDLNDYVGKKVKIWGQTFPPQKAGWFMDVGKIELLE